MQNLPKTLYSTAIAATVGGLVASYGYSKAQIVAEKYAGADFSSDIFGYGRSQAKSEIDSANQIMTFGGFMLLLGGALFAFFFAVWLYRTTEALRASDYETKKSPKWAAGSLFVPVLNMFVIHRTLKDLFTGLDRRSSQTTPTRHGMLSAAWIVAGFGYLMFLLVQLDSSSMDVYERFSTEYGAQNLGFLANVSITLTIGFGLAIAPLKRLRDKSTAE